MSVGEVRSKELKGAGTAGNPQARSSQANRRRPRFLPAPPALGTGPQLDSAGVLGVIVLLASLLFGGQGVRAQPQPDGAALKLLLVDETQTVEDSLFVNFLGTALRRMSLFDIESSFVTVASRFSDPLGRNEDARRYDIIVLVTAEPDLAGKRHIWLVTCPRRFVSAEVINAVETVSTAFQRITRQAPQARFEVALASDPRQPAFFTPLFQRSGWLDCRL